ncbi:transcriptional regulator [Paraburkholderia sp. RCC_158]|uniref:HVO_A0114 family putative DNA-binding protein n=2 Tax=Paraburkholderia TaxID=1822464 RepID=UPI00352638F4
MNHTLATRSNIMKTVTLGLGSRDALNARFVAAMNGEAQGEHITFDSPELLFQILTPERWNIIRTMTGAGPLSIREIAQRLGRDDAAVQHDVLALLHTGVLDRNADGVIEFPYDAVHVDFMITAA